MCSIAAVTNLVMNMSISDEISSNTMSSRDTVRVGGLPGMALWRRLLLLRAGVGCSYDALQLRIAYLQLLVGQQIADAVIASALQDASKRLRSPGLQLQTLR